VNDRDKKLQAFLKALAVVLLELRQKAGWSQNELAWRAGLSQQYIGYLEKQLRSPSAETLKRLAIAYDRDLHEIIAEAEAIAATSEEMGAT
jgi:transcriptional regulator with XRE-family HTH domain